MPKYFVVSDVHSFYDELIESLTQAGFDKDNPDHIFISCGDLFDYGPKPIECVDFVNNLPANRKFLIRGNHEILLQDCLEDKILTGREYSKGTALTIISFAIPKGGAPSIPMTNFSVFEFAENNPRLKKYLNSLVDYAEIGNYIFVHGWVPSKKDETTNNKWVLSHRNWKDGDWYCAAWINGMDAWKDNDTVTNKIIVCGHSYFKDNSDSPLKNGIFSDSGIIAIDGYNKFSNKINCFTFES